MTRWLLLCLCLLLSPAQADGWTRVQNTMRDGRWAGAFCLLPGGHAALLAGGYSFEAGACVATADRFDETLRRFVPCRGRLTIPRDFATATLLPDGTALVAGGYNTVYGSLDTAEAYDPRTDTFHVLGSHLSAARELFTATPLTDGRVLIAGGFNTHAHQTQDTADLFDPATSTFSRLPSRLSADRFGQAAARLLDGRILLVGGTHWHVGQPGVPLASADVFDPRTGRFHRTPGDMTVPRDRPTATLLPDGTVLIAGGQNGASGPRLAELFHPDTETFTPLAAPLTQARMAHADLLLPDGRVLLAGGWGPDAHATLTSCEIYDPTMRSFTPGPPLPFSAHDAALLQFLDGLILAAGGKHVGQGQESSINAGAIWQAARP